MSDPVRPHRRQPTRLPRPWDSPSKNTGVGVAISFSNAWKWKVKVKSLSNVWLFATPWTAAYQARLSMGFSRQECWSDLPTYLYMLCVDVCVYIKFRTFYTMCIEPWMYSDGVALQPVAFALVWLKHPLGFDQGSALAVYMRESFRTVCLLVWQLAAVTAYFPQTAPLFCLHELVWFSAASITAQVKNTLFWAATPSLHEATLCQLCWLHCYDWLLSIGRVTRFVLSWTMSVFWP